MASARNITSLRLDEKAALQRAYVRGSQRVRLSTLLGNHLPVCHVERERNPVSLSRARWGRIRFIAAQVNIACVPATSGNLPVAAQAMQIAKLI